MKFDGEAAKDIISAHKDDVGGVIAALRAVQNLYKCIPNQVDKIIADVFNISRAEVRGIVSFYADFSREKKAETVVKLCAAEACQAVGARTLQKDVESHVGCQVGQSPPNGDVSIEHVFCLGLCSVAPAAMVKGVLIGKADLDRIEAEIARTKKATSA